MRLGNGFERLTLAPHVQRGRRAPWQPPPDNRVFLFMVLLRLENVERRKCLNSALFSKVCQAHERSRHDQANRKCDSKGPERKEMAEVNRLLQHIREERRGKTHKDAGNIGTD